VVGDWSRRVGVSDLECRVSVVGCRVLGVGCTLLGVRCRMWAVGCIVSGVGFRKLTSVSTRFKESSFEEIWHI
jgi:hypothetical protein